jgi:NAD(P)-dependent dehydrogenase (short-subunit alcohol dehydrogenase family)
VIQRFKDKIVLIVGGNSGIGLASAKAFAEEGAKVAVAGRDATSLASAETEIGHGAISLRADICELAQIDALLGAARRCFERIDVLFVNAGVLSMRPMEAVTEEEWDYVLGTNLKGVFFCVQKALPLMRTGSSIVLTGSTAARKAAPDALAYAASKAGLRSLGRSLAAGLIGKGIRVNVVSPGPIHTPIFDRVDGLSAEGASALRRELIEAMPMKRMGIPEEVASAVLFLASDAAIFITGIELLVDGGIVSF